MSGAQRDAFRFHALFAVVAAFVLWLPADVALGTKMFGLVLGWHLGFLATALIRGHRAWLSLWWFATVLSVLQVLPDWFLVDGLGTLRFPPDGFPDIGPVTGYMAGMWAIAVVVIVMAASSSSRDETMGYVVAGVVGLGVFALAEATLTRLPVWQAVGVETVSRIAIYIIIAEVVLSLAVWNAWQRIHSRGPIAAVPAAARVMLTYMGAAGVSWLVVERIWT